MDDTTRLLRALIDALGFYVEETQGRQYGPEIMPGNTVLPGFEVEPPSDGKNARYIFPITEYKVLPKIESTAENWENGTLGCDERYIGVAEPTDFSEANISKVRDLLEQAETTRDKFAILHYKHDLKRLEKMQRKFGIADPQAVADAGNTLLGKDNL